MTEPDGGGAPRWVPLLHDAGRGAGHELRNALNALVVNLEVVRSRAEGLDPAVQPFLANAIEQSEESVRMAEGAIALLNLVIGAVSPGGTLRISDGDRDAVRIESTEPEAERAIRALEPLTARAAFGAERRGPAVILSIPDTSPESKATE